MRKRQGELFADGSEVKYFAVASNQWEWDAARLLAWQREKAGTIEALHEVLKNELAAGVMPCGRFGANAAWLRLAVMTHNVLTALKRLALPEKWLRARPKRLRFQIFCSPGKLVSHARKTWLRVRRLKEQLAEWIESLRLGPVAIHILGASLWTDYPTSFENRRSKCAESAAELRPNQRRPNAGPATMTLFQLTYRGFGRINASRPPGCRWERGNSRLRTDYGPRGRDAI